MPSWWGKSSSKESKKKKNKEGLIDALGLRSKAPSEANSNGKSGRSKKRSTFMAPDRGSNSSSVSRLSSPSEQVPRCQSFSEGPHSQPLPSPVILPTKVARTHSHSSSAKQRVEKGFKPSSFLPIPRPICIRKRRDSGDFEGNIAVGSASSGTSIASDDPIDSGQRSPLATDFDNWNRIAGSSPSRSIKDDTSTTGTPLHTRAPLIPANPISSNPISPHMWTKKKHFQGHLPKLELLPRGTFYSAPNSSPCKSPVITGGNDQTTSLWTGRPYQDAHILGSGHCSSPGSGYNSGQNSMGGDMSGPLFWQPSRSSPEYSPIPSPIMTSPGPGSRIHSGAVTPLHPRAGGLITEAQTSWNDEGKQQSHPLPLPPQILSNSSPYSRSNSAATSPSVPRSPGRAENFTSLGSCWKKGKMLGRGTFGHVYVGFNSESGEMCAMKEVTLFYDDTKSKECAKQLVQEIALLSRLRHPNIVQYYGSEMIGDKLYIYLEYVSGGSIYKLLQDYGQFGELVIRNYTQQILSGLSYLHERNTVHRDIKGANILVDPNGRVKLADFGMAKHITGQSCPLSFKGSPYWMAPEVIKNSNGCNISVDIWSLGCTVLEMATTKPPWGQYEGVAAMFKIGNSKDLPFIPDHLSDEGKDFVRKCLQRNPLHRPTAAQLLEHPFVKNPFPAVERQPSPGSDFTVTPFSITKGMKSLGMGEGKSVCSSVESETQTARSLKAITFSSGREGGAYSQRYISCPVSPIGSPILHSRSPNSSTTSPPPLPPHFLHFNRPSHTSPPPLRDTSSGRGILPRLSDREYFSGPFFPGASHDAFRARVPPHPFPFDRIPASAPRRPITPTTPP